MSQFTAGLRRRDLAWAVSLVVMLSAVWLGRSDIADAGTEPPGEGIAVVYIAVGTGFPDALGAGPGAALNGAPILVVPTNPPMDDATANELVRLDPKTVIIVGGTGVISDAMQTAIAALLPNAVITRIAGANRYETNAALSAATYPIEGWISGFPWVITSGGEDVMTAYVNLPHGAEILELAAEVSDGISNSELTLELYRWDGTTAELIAGVASGVSFNGGNLALSDSSMAGGGLAIVDNSTYAYYLEGTGTLGTLEALSVRLAKIRYRLGASG